MAYKETLQVSEVIIFTKQFSFKSTY